MSTYNLHMDADSSYIRNCQNLEATTMSFSEWINVVSPDNGMLFGAEKK